MCLLSFGLKIGSKRTDIVSVPSLIWAKCRVKQGSLQMPVFSVGLKIRSSKTDIAGRCVLSLGSKTTPNRTDFIVASSLIRMKNQVTQADLSGSNMSSYLDDDDN